MHLFLEMLPRSDHIYKLIATKTTPRKPASNEIINIPGPIKENNLKIITKREFKFISSLGVNRYQNLI